MNNVKLRFEEELVKFMEMFRQQDGVRKSYPLERRVNICFSNRNVNLQGKSARHAQLG